MSSYKWLGGSCWAYTWVSHWHRGMFSSWRLWLERGSVAPVNVLIEVYLRVYGLKKLGTEVCGYFLYFFPHPLLFYLLLGYLLRDGFLRWNYILLSSSPLAIHSHIDMWSVSVWGSRHTVWTLAAFRSSKVGSTEAEGLCRLVGYA